MRWLVLGDAAIDIRDKQKGAKLETTHASSTASQTLYLHLRLSFPLGEYLGKTTLSGAALAYTRPSSTASSGASDTRIIFYRMTFIHPESEVKIEQVPCQGRSMHT